MVVSLVGLVIIKDKMEIKRFDTYRDGGTIKIETNRGTFCFDNRISSNTKGRLYEGYPKRDNSNIIENSGELEAELLEVLKSYKHSFYQKAIDHFVSERTKS